ncbi:MAG: hypothetical protein M1504_00935 [Candidatus Marsarchaeota archaeon]|nr:hypothetical protein [Candidatus Marsarchaeota archaeon]
MNRAGHPATGRVLFIISIIILSNVSFANNSQRLHLNFSQIEPVNILDNISNWKASGFNVYNISANYASIGNVLTTNGVSLASQQATDNNGPSNWAGYSAIYNITGANNFYAKPYSVSAIAGSWKVQSVPYQSSSSLLQSAQWIGIGGMLNDSQLIQVGTFSNSKYSIGTLNGNTYLLGQYFPVYELLSFSTSGQPRVLTTNHTLSSNGIFSLPIGANDTMYAEIKIVNQSSKTWFIFIGDMNQSWVAFGNVTYNSFQSIADFVEEDPCANNCSSFQPFPNFGYSNFGEDFAPSGFRAEIVDMNGRIAPLGSLPHLKYIMSPNFSILATPDPITPDGTSFGITYGALRVSNITSTSLKEGKSNKVVLHATVLGETNPSNLTYKWYIVNRTNFARTFIKNSYTNDTITITQAKPNVTYAVFVSDNGLTPNPVAYNYTTASPLITVNPNNLTAPTIFPQTPKLDNSQSVTLNATENLTPTSGNLIWQWYIVSNSNTLFPISNTNGSTIVVSPSSNTAYEVSVTATTGNGKLHYSISDNVLVATTPTITMIPSSTFITLGQSVNITATIPSNVGFGPFVTDLILSANIVSTKTISSNGGNVVFTYTPATIGNYIFSLLAIDTGTSIPFSFLSISNTVTVLSSNVLICSNNWTGGACIGSITYNTATTLSNDVSASGSITVDNGVNLTTDGHNIWIGGNFINYGVIITDATGNSGGALVPQGTLGHNSNGNSGTSVSYSYGGSGGGGGEAGHDLCVGDGGNGGNTLVIGGTGAGVGSAPGGNGNNGGNIAVTNSNIQSWHNDRFQNYLSGAGGGGGGSSCASIINQTTNEIMMGGIGMGGGLGSSGLYIQASNIITGTILANGIDGQSANVLGSGGAGGGGGIVILAYKSGNITPNTIGVNVLGGIGGLGNGNFYPGGTAGGNGGNGAVVTYVYTTPPLATPT